MLGFNLFTAQRLAEERMKDAKREAEQAWLIRAVKVPRKSWRLGVQLSCQWKPGVPLLLAGGANE